MSTRDADRRSLIFFIGTDAELIKVFPVMLMLQSMGIDFLIVCSGQNDLTESYLLNHIIGRNIDLELSKESSIVKSARGLFGWFLKTNATAPAVIKSSLNYSEDAVLIVHGDTISTVMGARIAKKLGLRLAHIEAGLRSFNWFNPFPEEIDRSIVSRHVDIHFAPGNVATQNLKGTRAPGLIVNTHNNTLLDSLQIAQKIPCKDAELDLLCRQPHSVMVIHRQENLSNHHLVQEMVDIACLPSDVVNAFILHEPTRVTLEAMGLLEKLASCQNVHLLPRVEYCDFMKLLATSEYVLTDGGSNQEELSYMGVPALILRTHTERQEGLGSNARLFDGKAESIKQFLDSYETMRRTPLEPNESPALIIAAVLADMIEEDA